MRATKEELFTVNLVKLLEVDALKNHVLFCQRYQLVTCSTTYAQSTRFAPTPTSEYNLGRFRTLMRSKSGEESRYLSNQQYQINIWVFQTEKEGSTLQF